MQFIDTHTHLYSEAFDSDRDTILHRAFHSGVKTLLLPNIDASSIEPMHQLCATFPDHCHPMMGLHPGYVKEDWKQQLQCIEKALFSTKYIAIGEIGMDLYWDKTYRTEQEIVFREQIQWAKTLNLPIVIHARDAFDELFSILDEVHDANLTGVFHCFTGTIQQAEKILEYNTFMLGIGGVLTFKSSGLDAVVNEIPLEMLLLETDAPYLAPTPHRGKRNESSFIPLIASKLAAIKGLDVSKIAEVTSMNAKRLFKL
jgi:TatD DNase family protein